MNTLEFKLPDVGEGLDKGLIVAWRVEVGETVAADQIIAEVETDKAIVEIPAPVNGTIVKLGAAIGAELAVGDVLAVFETNAPSPKPQTSEPQTSEAAAPTEAPERAAQSAPAPTSPEGMPTVESQRGSVVSGVGRVKASPATRKLARSLNIELALVAGTGGRGQVTREDVLAHSQAPTPAPSPSPSRPAPARATPAAAARPEGEDRVEPLSGLRRQIALNMDMAWRTVPHIFTLEEIEATRLVEARRALNEDRAGDAPRMSYLPFFVKACVAALTAHPRFNASLDLENERITYHHRINAGIATATPEGLIVTVVHDADQKSLNEIAVEIETLAALARERRVSVEQIRGATVTLSNYGSYGAWMGTPIVRPPEVAIAGFGRIREAVVPVDGVPAVRTVLPMVVSTDHRLNDGEHLGAFLSTIIHYLSEPVRLLGT